MTANSTVDNLVSDEVIKRRLLIDGDGAGDDRKILGVIKSFLSWCINDEQDEEEHLSYKRLVNQIHQIEHGNAKTHFAIKVNEKAKDAYLNLDEQVIQEIEKAKEQIEDSKKLLLNAKERRKNRTEYNALARIIKTKPDRRDTESKRLTLEKDFLSLQNERKSLEDRLEHRKRNMRDLVIAIHHLQDLLDAEDQPVVRLETSSEKQAVEHSIPMDIDEQPLSSSAISNSEPMSVGTDHEPGETSSSDSLGDVSGIIKSNPGSPLEQVAERQEQDHSINSILGIISSVPCSPMDAEKSEKYDDLSESDNESGGDN